MKLIFLDADGTLLQSNGIVPESAIIACQKAKQNGHLICLATGRQPIEIIGDLTKINYDACICGSGATVVIKDKIVYDNKIDFDEGKKLKKYFSTNHIPLILDTSSGLFAKKDVVDYLKKNLNQICKGYSEEEKKNHSLSLVIELIQILNDKQFDDCPFNKLSFLNSPIPICEIENHFKDKYDIISSTYEPYGPNSGELTKKGITKANGIRIISDYYHIKKKDVISIGDNYNDLPMFEESSISVAMGNSNNDIKEKANYVTTNIDQDGIYNAFKYLKLI